MNLLRFPLALIALNSTLAACSSESTSNDAAVADTGVDAASDVAFDLGTDVPSVDAPVDVRTDVALDTAVDAPVDTAVDAPVDASADVPATDADNPLAQRCTSTGGTVDLSLCCGATPDFPSSCLTGACGCAPSSSHMVQVCRCPGDTCFDPSAGCRAR